MTSSSPKSGTPESAASKSAAPRKGPLPVTVLSGFLGAGKTTLLKRILENPDGLRIATLVNDVAAVNIDGAMVSSLDQAEEVVQLENGCICCTLRDSLMDSLLKMSQNTAIDYCIVESTGVSEPRPVAETFTFVVGEAQDEDGKPIGDVPLSKFVRLDTCVTMVDAANFPDTLSSRENARQRWGEEGDEGEKDVAQILADQLEFADVVVVNKCDLVDEKQAAHVCSTVRAFNLSAKVLKSTKSKVALKEVVGTNLFDFERACSDTPWLAELRGESQKGELEEFGISSMVYNRRRPFHPKRFAAAAIKLARYGNALLRSKGFVWLASKNEGFGEWSQTGVVWTLEPAGHWLCETPREEWPSTDPGFVEKAEADMHEDPKIGDRRQEMVFIGQGLKEKEIIKLMDDCLLTDEEMKDESKWRELEDPFGEWDFTAEDDESEEDEEEEEEEAEEKEEKKAKGHENCDPDCQGDKDTKGKKKKDTANGKSDDKNNAENVEKKEIGNAEGKSADDGATNGNVEQKREDGIANKDEGAVDKSRSNGENDEKNDDSVVKGKAGDDRVDRDVVAANGEEKNENAEGNSVDDGATNGNIEQESVNGIAKMKEDRVDKSGEEKKADTTTLGKRSVEELDTAEGEAEVEPKKTKK